MLELQDTVKVAQRELAAAREGGQGAARDVASLVTAAQHLCTLAAQRGDHDERFEEVTEATVLDALEWLGRVVAARAAG